MSLYSRAHCPKRTLIFALTSGSVMASVAATRRRSRRGSSAKERWKRMPAFPIRASRIYEDINIERREETSRIYRLLGLEAGGGRHHTC